MGTDIKRLLKDKRVLAGVGVVAAIALVVAIRRRNSGGGGTSGTATPAAPSGYYAPGTGDTSGANLSGFLGNWGQAQLSAQQAGFQSILDALKGGGAGQNDDQPPTVVYSKDPQGKPFWALLNSPYGGWMQTTDQGTANSWASQWGGSDNTADTVSWDAWLKLQEKWNK
jgi:hypothetical protein